MTHVLAEAQKPVVALRLVLAEAFLRLRVEVGVLAMAERNGKYRTQSAFYQ